MATEKLTEFILEHVQTGMENELNLKRARSLNVKDYFNDLGRPVKCKISLLFYEERKFNDRINEMNPDLSLRLYVLHIMIK